MTTATFTPTSGGDRTWATAAGFFPGRHTVDVTEVTKLADGVYRMTFRDAYVAKHRSRPSS